MNSVQVLRLELRRGDECDECDEAFNALAGDTLVVVSESLSC